MNIHFPSFSFPISLFQESILDTLTARQKKIVAVAALAFACLAAAYYIAARCCIKAKLQDEEADQKMPGITPNPPSQEDETDVSSEKEERKVLTDSTIEIGSRLNDTLHGKGERLFKNGITEKGTFDNGVLVEGIKKNQSNIISEGKFDQEGFLNGSGKITFPEGDVYEGEFIEDQLCGKGKITFHNGNIEEGTFKEGYLYGPGKITYPNGNVKEGLFEKSVLIETKMTLEEIEEATEE